MRAGPSMHWLRVSMQSFEVMKNSLKFLLLLAVVAVSACGRDDPPPAATARAQTSSRQLELSDVQAKSVDTLQVEARDFHPIREAVGYIDFDQYRTVAVTPQWTGRVREVFVQANQQVAKGKPLFSIDSTDLAQAESNLIATQGVAQLQARALERAKAVNETAGGARKDVDQSTSDQQTAVANYRAAEDTLRVFGKSPAEIRAIAQSRHVNGVLVVTSPISGIVVNRNLAPGLVVQPGMSPAPVTVSDMSSVWMIGSVAEDDLPALRVGQSVKVKVDAYPDREFEGTLDSIGASADATTHRITVRTKLADPRHELRAQMLATAELEAGSDSTTVAVPIDAVVRESSGEMTVYVTPDGRRFSRRVVKIGSQQDGYYPIVDGLKPGERIAGKSALFIANELYLRSQ